MGKRSTGSYTSWLILAAIPFFVHEESVEVLAELSGQGSMGKALLLVRVMSLVSSDWIIGTVLNAYGWMHRTSPGQGRHMPAIIPCRRIDGSGLLQRNLCSAANGWICCKLTRLCTIVERDLERTTAVQHLHAEGPVATNMEKRGRIYTLWTVRLNVQNSWLTWVQRHQPGIHLHIIHAEI